MKFSLGKEWDDLKKFENLTDDEKSIVFYSENEDSSFIFNSLSIGIFLFRYFIVSNLNCVINNKVFINPYRRSFFIASRIGLCVSFSAIYIS